MNELDKITARFGRAYAKRDQAVASLKRQQTNMFDAFTKAMTQRPLARKKVPHPVDEDDLTAWVKKYHPGWKSFDATPDGDWLILQEDPAYAKFTHVNPETKMVYGRTVAEGPLSLDDEALRQEQPALWERITEWPEPWYSMITEIIRDFTSLTWSHTALETRVGQYLSTRGLHRVIKDFSKLNDEDIMELQSYLVPSPLTIRLVPPREAKPEELEHVQSETRDQEPSA